MHPHQLNHNDGRKFKPGQQYYVRRTDGYAQPIAISPYETPKGFIHVIATSETEYEIFKGQRADTLDTLKNAGDNKGAALSYDSGHQEATARRMPVSNPQALDDHQVRERIKARQEEFSPAQSNLPYSQNKKADPQAVEVPGHATRHVDVSEQLQELQTPPETEAPQETPEPVLTSPPTAPAQGKKTRPRRGRKTVTEALSGQE